MGQKVNPISLRLQKTNRHFDSSWYNEYNYSSLFLQDLQIKNYLNFILKQIQYSQGRFLVLNLPKKVLINFFYFNPKKFRAQNNKVFQILRKNKKKSSFFASSRSLVSNSFSPVKGRKEGGWKSNISNYTLQITDLLGGGKKRDQRFKKEKDWNTVFNPIPIREENQEKRRFTSFPFKGRIPNSYILNLKKKKDSLKREGERNVIKFLLTSLKSNPSTGSLHNINNGSDIVGRRNIQNLASDLSTSYQPWIDKKDLYTFLSFLSFTVNSLSSFSFLCSADILRNQNVRNAGLQNIVLKTEVLRNQNVRNGGKGALLCSTKTKELLKEEGKKKDRQRFSSQICEKSKRFLNRYLLFLFYNSNSNNKRFNHLGLGEELVSGSSLSLPFEIKSKDLSLTPKRGVYKEKQIFNLLKEKRFFVKLLPALFVSFTDQGFVRNGKSGISRREESVEIKDWKPTFSPLPDKERMLWGGDVKGLKDLHLSKVNNNDLSWRYSSHIEFSFFKNFFSSTDIRFFRSLTEKGSALFLAQETIYYLERRIPFRRIKNQILRTIGKSKIIKGIRITCSGRVGGKSKKAQRAKVETLKLGQTSLHVFSSKIDFACKSALTNFGLVGVKVWICYF